MRIWMGEFWCEKVMGAWHRKVFHAGCENFLKLFSKVAVRLNFKSAPMSQNKCFLWWNNPKCCCFFPVVVVALTVWSPNHSAYVSKQHTVTYHIISKIELLKAALVDKIFFAEQRLTKLFFELLYVLIETSKIWKCSWDSCEIIECSEFWAFSKMSIKASPETILLPLKTQKNFNNILCHAYHKIAKLKKRFLLRKEHKSIRSIDYQKMTVRAFR